MSRRSRAGDAGALLIAAVLFGPYTLGYFSPWLALALLIVVVFLTWRMSLNHGPSEPRWVARHPILSVLAFVWLGCGVGWGILNRHASETEEARRAADEAARVHEQEAYVAQEEATRQARELAERQRVEAARLAEARRTPAERVAIAQQILAHPSKGLHDRVCEARRALAPIPEAERRRPEIRAVLRVLRAAERADLREIRAAAADGRMILCCDGQTSPSCECGRSNRRGCCSWHGGICGCEPLPDQVICHGD